MHIVYLKAFKKSTELYKILYIFICFIILACKNRNKEFNGTTINSFPTPIRLDGEQVFKNEFSIASIQFVDSLLVLTVGQDTLFHIYDKNGNRITTFGRKGKGPREFLRPPFLRQIASIDSDKVAVIYDEAQKKVELINMTSSITKGNIVVFDEFKPPSSINNFAIQDIYYLDKDKYVGVYDNRLSKKANQLTKGFYLDLSTNAVKKFSLRNLKMEPFDRMAELNLNIRHTAISPRKSKLIFAMMLSPYFAILNTKSGKAKEFKYSSHELKRLFKLSNFQDRKFTMYNSDVFATDKRVYLLSSVNKWDDANKYQIIRVIDWNGEPLKKFTISSKYLLSRIIVDEQEREIYGISWKNDKVYQFSYNNIDH